VGDARMSSTATLSAGTRTLDSQALGTIVFGVNTTANVVQLATSDLLTAAQGYNGWPLVLAQNEGFEIQATVPATGTWVGIATVYWSEYSAFP
jgi:hypothetical protein